VRIQKSKMTQLDYWTPARSSKFIINRIYNILDEYACLKNNDEEEKIFLEHNNLIKVIN
jgi:hypothetical protein